MGAPEHSLAVFDALRELAAVQPVSVRVNGVCMTPLVSEGARVDVAAPARFYWPGDVVVVFLGARGYALHRVIGCYRRGGQWKFVTQGDRTHRPDTAVTAPLILGRVCGGECSKDAIRVPLRHRLRACGRFLRHAHKTFFVSRCLA